jgi:hypothetical protein
MNKRLFIWAGKISKQVVDVDKKVFAFVIIYFAHNRTYHLCEQLYPERNLLSLK